MQSIFDLLCGLLLGLVGLIVGLIAVIEGVCRMGLATLGLVGGLQTALLWVIFLIVSYGILRLFGRLFLVLLMGLLFIYVLHIFAVIPSTEPVSSAQKETTESL